MPNADEAKPHGPLAGIRVLDITRVLAGPWASQLLADYGAEVIKLERPVQGDDTRRWGPPWLQDRNGRETGDSAYFLSTNRNKRSVTVNLGHPDGAQLARDLAARADVIMENFKVGTMQKFGLDFAALSTLNPALVYCSISAYGQQGSRSLKPGYDAMIQASGGLMSITGEPDGSPQKVGVAIADIMAGMYAATAILAALVERDRSGKGQYLDVPLYDSQVAWLANQNMNFLIGNEVPGRLGTAHPNLVPYQAFQCADGFLMLAVGNDRQFRACCECLGIAATGTDDRFATNATRVANRADLIEIMTDAFMGRPAAYWLDALGEQGVPAGPIQSIGDVLCDEFAEERELVRVLAHADGTTVPTVANPVRFSETPVEYRHAPPRLGQHTIEVLSEELGLDDARIRTLQESGAI
ncbi:MAG: CoA transferase [Gammaproteobacteria bacterium]|nr:CoA transferase [Gammaproteobacteria bacterium]